MASKEERLDKKFDALFARNEKRAARKLRSNFAKLSRDVLAAFNTGGVLNAEAVVIKNDIALEAVLQEIYESSATDAARFTLNQLKEELGDSELGQQFSKARDLEEERELGLLEATIAIIALLWIPGERRKWSAQINRTTLKIFNKFVDEATNAGLAGKAFDKFVTRGMKKENVKRITTIATTESGRAITKAQQQVAVDTEKVLVKSWRSQRDKAVRDSHIRADKRYTEEPIAIGEMFQVGASAGIGPRADTLSPEESINCRCYIVLKAPK